MTLFTRADLYDPQALGLRDFLVVNHRIALVSGSGQGLDPRAVARALGLPSGSSSLEVVDLGGARVLPGLVDPHLHITGGGGEGGFNTRAEEASATGLLRFGITTVAGLLGTDSITRSLESLLAKAHALQAQGLCTRIYTGAYRYPVPTLTGSVDRDLVLVDKVVGVGELAIADHRGSMVTEDELARLASQARQGGLLSGKPGLVHLHIGDHGDGLGLVFRVLDRHHLPPSQFYPTHVNRTRALATQAARLAKAGAPVDLTAGFDGDASGTDIGTSLRELWALGVPPDRITASSDAHGSMPVFDATGALVGIETAAPSLLWHEVRRAVVDQGLPLEAVWATVSANSARVLGLKSEVGQLAPGLRADFVVLDADLDLAQVWSAGECRWTA